MQIFRCQLGNINYGNIGVFALTFALEISRVAWLLNFALIFEVYFQKSTTTPFATRRHSALDFLMLRTHHFSR